MQSKSVLSYKNDSISAHGSDPQGASYLYFYGLLAPRATNRRLVRQVPCSDVFSPDTKQASRPCFLSLRWGWLLLTRQRAPLQDGDTPLHDAALNGKEGAIKVLLEAGADRGAKNNVSGERR